MIDYEVRSLRRDELEEMLVLTSTAYNSSVDTFRRIYEHDPFYDFELTRVADHKGNLIAYLRAAPRTIWIGSSKLRMGGIAEVCTLQEYRKMGIAMHLLRDMVHLMTRRGFPVSMLYGRDTFYRKVGWERSSIVHRLRIPPVYLPRYAQCHSVRAFKENDLPDVMAIYNSTYAHRSCAILRNELHWRGRILNRTRIRVYDKGGVKGYMALSLREERVNGGTRNVLFVQEVGYRSRNALQALIGDLASSENCDMIACGGPAGDGFLSALSLPGATLSVGWDGMFRVNDVMGTLKSLREAFRGFEGRMALKVRDDVVASNSDTFIIEGSGGDPTFTRGEGSEETEWIEVDIRELSQMVPGTLSVRHLASTGKLDFSSSKALDFADELFPKRNPFQPPIDHF